VPSHETQSRWAGVRLQYAASLAVSVRVLIWVTLAGDHGEASCLKPRLRICQEITDSTFDRVRLESLQPCSYTICCRSDRYQAHSGAIFNCRAAP
jgi:hypothetical protein